MDERAVKGENNVTGRAGDRVLNHIRNELKDFKDEVRVRLQRIEDKVDRQNMCRGQPTQSYDRQ